MGKESTAYSVHLVCWVYLAYLVYLSLFRVFSLVWFEERNQPDALMNQKNWVDKMYPPVREVGKLELQRRDPDKRSSDRMILHDFEDFE